MTQKQYIFWNSGAIWQAPATSTITLDRWTSISSAMLSWQIEGTNGFDNIQLNGVTLAEGNGNKAGQKDVRSNLIQGAKNTCKLNYQTPAQTIMGLAQAGSATVVLTIIGTMNASYETILAQNAVFKNARQTNQIDQNQYQTALTVQNSQLQQLLAQGDITSQQYQDAITMENLDASTIPAQGADSTSSGDGSNNNQNNNSNSSSALPDTLGQLSGNLQLEYFGLPVYAWIIVAIILIAVAFFLWKSGQAKKIIAAATAQGK